MTPVTSTNADLVRNLRKVTETLYGNYRDLSLKRQKKLESVAKTVDDYNASRSKLISEELAARSMDWCTWCKEACAQADVALILVEGTEEYSYGYGNFNYDFRNFSTLHRGCASCRAHANERHGWTGEYDSQAKNRSKFFAFEAEKWDTGYYAKKFGKWVLLKEGCEERLLWDVPDELTDKLTHEWNLPGRIKLDHTGAIHLPD